MNKQEQEHNEDLEELKSKLKRMESIKPPEDKDKMIDYLMERLQAAEEAIKVSEEIITHERTNRKEMSKDLKQRN